MTTSYQDNKFFDALEETLGSDTQWIVDWVKENFTPEEVFEDDELDSWALEHGWVEEDEVNKIQESLDDAESEIEDLKSDKSDLEEQINSLQDSLEECRDEVHDLSL